MRTQEEKGAAFRALHEGTPFVIPNPYDAGSARMLEGLGFKALATTSSGFAFTLGKHDGEVTLDEIAAHVSSLAAATDLPVSVDLENGYGPDPAQVTIAIARVAEAGAVGASIEDWDREGFLYPVDVAAERIAAAAQTAHGLAFPFVLTARAENHLRGNPDLDDTIARLSACAEAGADVVFAPGVREPDAIRRIHDEVGRPVNVLARAGVRLSDLTDAGAQRISVGGGLTWTAVDAMVAAARLIAEDGDFSGLAIAPSLPD